MAGLVSIINLDGGIWIGSSHLVIVHLFLYVKLTFCLTSSRILTRKTGDLFIFFIKNFLFSLVIKVLRLKLSNVSDV